MQICPGCQKENSNDAQECACGYSFSLEHDNTWKGFFYRLRKPAIWIGIIAAILAIFNYLYQPFNFGPPSEYSISKSAAWSIQQFSGISISLPITLHSNKIPKQYQEALELRYSDYKSSIGIFNDLSITINYTVDAVPNLPDLANWAEWAAKALVDQPYFVSEQHNIEDRNIGNLSGKLLKSNTQLKSQILIYRILLLKDGLRRWTIQLSYHPSPDGDELAQKILASVHTTQ